MARRRSGAGGMVRFRPQMIAVSATAIALALVILLIVISEGSTPPPGSPVVACIDSTVSTNGVRTSYRQDVEAVARRAVADHANVYADACGANATGMVRWPVHARFSSKLEGALGREQIERRLEAISGELKSLLRVSPSEDGTPFGEMLAVAADQCEQAGGDCVIYFFTDGEWADGLIKVSDGVTETEKKRYVETYEAQIGDLTGSQVNFIGVGHGTKMGAIHLGEAEAVAAALVRAAGGEMGSWSIRL